MSTRWVALVSILALAGVIWAGLTLSRLINGPQIHIERLSPDRVKPLPKHWAPLEKGFEEPTPVEIQALRARIAADPGDADARGRLLLSTFAEDTALHAEQVLWFIVHQPDHPILSSWQAEIVEALASDAFHQGVEGYEAAMKASPDKAQILSNFATFLAFEDKSRAVQLRRRSVELEPKNGGFHYELGSAIQLSWLRTKPTREAAIEALEAFRRARRLGYRVPAAEIAEAAFEARDPEASSLIRNALKDSLSFSNEFALHGYLGILRLEAGDLAGAERHLLDSPTAQNEPQSDELPLDLRLAQMLSELDQRETLIRFINLLKARWRPDTCREWLEALGDGKRVNFSLSPHALYSPNR